MHDAWECESCHRLQAADAPVHHAEHAGLTFAVCESCALAAEAERHAERSDAAIDAAVAEWDRTGILRVGLLRTLLDRWQLDDSTPVVLADGDGWYVNVRHLESERTDEDYACLTLFPGSAWDARSL